MDSRDDLVRGVLHYIEQDIAGKKGRAWMVWDWIFFGYWISA